MLSYFRGDIYDLESTIILLRDVLDLKFKITKTGLALWSSGLGHHLRYQHPLLECQFKFQLLCFHSSSC